MTKKQFKNCFFRLAATALFLAGLLITFVLCPILLYANKTEVGNYSIYHNKPIDKIFRSRLEQADVLIRSSELYDPALKIDICLHDGSTYPGLITHVLGKDFILSFYNKIVFTGDVVNEQGNCIQLGQHRWNLTQMIAHAEIHCLEFNRYGLWQSNPLGRHPDWKWEGYPEYVARQIPRDKDLKANIKTLLQAEQFNDNGWIRLPDSSETLNSYYKYKLLIQFCMEIKRMSFVQLMKDTTQEGNITQQMMDWYKEQTK